ncbi:unnamed protein product [Ilex paraguariensis]|uniref:LOB domain-containing protein n=1 Tax=Ilex paraguariensis TaxID=185542 RepID=A0ABC8UZL3_9AQUA
MLVGLRCSQLFLASSTLDLAVIKEMVVNLQAELTYLQAHLATLELPTPPPPPPPQPLLTPPPFSISDLPTASCLPATYDLSALFDPMGQPSWAMQQRQMDPRNFGCTSTRASGEMSSPAASGGGDGGGGGGDLQELARELLHRQGSPPVPCSEASHLLPHTK